VLVAPDALRSFSSRAAPFPEAPGASAAVVRHPRRDAAKYRKWINAICDCCLTAKSTGTHWLAPVWRWRTPRATRPLYCAAVAQIRAIHRCCCNQAHRTAPRGSHRPVYSSPADISDKPPTAWLALASLGETGRTFYHQHKPWEQVVGHQRRWNAAGVVWCNRQGG
jgi:hypothetical protein